MFKTLFSFAQQTLFLQRDVQKLKDDVTQLQRQLHENNEVLRTILFELQRMSERETHERQKLELKIENAILRSKSLPQVKGAKRKKP